MDKRINEIIEAVLFAKGDAVSIKDISTIIDKKYEETENILLHLMEKYEKRKSGIKIIKVDDAFQMCTNPIYFQYIKKIYNLPQKKGLSEVILETLAIIAYKQPITKNQIEYIRGVNSDYPVNMLVKYELIEEKGRLDVIGKPIVFGTTKNFLKYFGFTSLKDLPDTKNNEDIQKIVEEELPKM